MTTAHVHWTLKTQTAWDLSLIISSDCSSLPSLLSPLPYLTVISTSHYILRINCSINLSLSFFSIVLSWISLMLNLKNESIYTSTLLSLFTQTCITFIKWSQWILTVLLYEVTSVSTCVKWGMFEITLTFAEEKFGFSDADLSLCWSDLHLDGGWVKKRRWKKIYISLRFQQEEWWHRGKAQKGKTQKSNCFACSKEQPFLGIPSMNETLG